MESKNVIITTIGTTFDIILESHVEGSEFGWCLKSIPPGVESASIEQNPVLTGQGERRVIRQIFTFIAMDILSQGKITFDLINLTDPRFSIAESIVYHINIYSDSQSAAFENGFKADKIPVQYQCSCVMENDNLIYRYKSGNNHPSLWFTWKMI